MTASITSFYSQDRREHSRSVYAPQAEWRFRQLVSLPDLDTVLKREPTALTEFEGALDTALATAFTADGNDEARLFLQRILYPDLSAEALLV